MSNTRNPSFFSRPPPPPSSQKESYFPPPREDIELAGTGFTSIWTRRRNLIPYLGAAHSNKR